MHGLDHPDGHGAGTVLELDRGAVHVDVPVAVDAILATRGGGGLRPARRALGGGAQQLELGRAELPPPDEEAVLPPGTTLVAAQAESRGANRGLLVADGGAAGPGG
jgi:hypothetical protein